MKEIPVIAGYYHFNTLQFTRVKANSRHCTRQGLKLTNPGGGVGRDFHQVRTVVMVDEVVIDKVVVSRRAIGDTLVDIYFKDAVKGKITVYLFYPNNGLSSTRIKNRIFLSTAKEILHRQIKRSYWRHQRTYTVEEVHGILKRILDANIVFKEGTFDVIANGTVNGESLDRIYQGFNRTKLLHEEAKRVGKAK